MSELIDKAIERIRKAAAIAEKYEDKELLLGFSGGKDSQAVFLLAQMAGVKFKSIHQLTTIDAPQTIHFIKRFYPDVHIIRPKKSYWQLCEEHSFIPNRFRRACCLWLKELSSPQTVTLTGVRRAESYKRAARGELSFHTFSRHPIFETGSFESFNSAAAKAGRGTIEVKCMQGKDRITVHPIIDWQDTDVWQFLYANNSPINPLYARGSRVGCICCPLSNYKNVLNDVRDYPKYYKAYIRLIIRIWAKFKAEGRQTWSWAQSPFEIFANCYLTFNQNQIRQERENIFGSPLLSFLEKSYKD